jgi:hypothetical protein
MKTARVQSSLATNEFSAILTGADSQQTVVVDSQGDVVDMLHEHAPSRGGVESRDTVLRISRLVPPSDEIQIVRDKTACLNSLAGYSKIDHSKSF